MEQTQPLERYIFRKPAWRRVVPTLLLLLFWVVPALLWKGSLLQLPAPATEWPARAIAFFQEFGISLEMAVVVASTLSGIILFWLFWGFEVLIITAEAITRRLPFGIRRTLRWVDVDEVLIDNVESRMEGDATARKTLNLYEIPKGLLRRRRRLEISNAMFDGYEDVERIAVQVSVPAVAARLRQRIKTEGKPAMFNLRQPFEGFLSFVLFFGGLAVLTAFTFETAWWKIVEDYFKYKVLWIARPLISVLALIAVLVGVGKFFYRQIGVDSENLYLYRRKRVRRKIPIDNIADIQIRDNQMRIYAFTKDPETPRQVFKSNRYIRNRGVLLRLIREEYEQHRALDATPIKPLRSTRAEA